MTLIPAWTSPTPDEMPFHCRTCRRALHRRHTPNGVLTFEHPNELRGDTLDHAPRPAPVTEVPDPIIECDFCSSPEALWVYVCADQETDTRLVTRQSVEMGDYRRRHYAARTRAVETARGPLRIWGERWSACDGCAALIEGRDLYGLIARVTDAMPSKLTRGRKLMTVRGLLHGNYSTVLETLRPGRGRITARYPLMAWEEAPDRADTGNGTGQQIDQRRKG